MYKEGNTDFVVKNIQTSKKDLWVHLIEGYVRTHGNLLAKDEEVYSGYPIGLRLKRTRAAYSQLQKGEKPCINLSEEDIDFLTDLGMVWDKKDHRKQKWYSLAKEYNNEHHHLNLTANEFYQEQSLGKKILKVRFTYQTQNTGGDLKTYAPLTKEEIKLWEDRNIAWYLEKKEWEKLYLAATVFYKQNGHLNISESYNRMDRKPSEILVLHDFIEESKKFLNDQKTDDRSIEKVRRLSRIGIK